MNLCRPGRKRNPRNIANSPEIAIYYVLATVTWSAIKTRGLYRLNRAPSPLHIELQPSRLLVRGLVTVYAIALGVVVSSRLPEPVIVLMVIVLSLMAWRDISKTSRSGSKHRIRRLVLFPGRNWVAVNGAGEATRGRPRGALLVHPWTVALTLADDDGNRTPVLVLPDMTGPRTFHALRLWLRQHSQLEINGVRA